MISVTAKSEGDGVTLTAEINGKGFDIVDEITAILIDLPKKLEELDPNLLHALKINFKHELEKLEREEETDGLN